MEDLLNHKKDIFLIFVIGFCLSMMSLYQTYAYDIDNDNTSPNRPTADIKYTFNLINNSKDTYTINLEPGETKLLDLTLSNDNNYNTKYILYTDRKIEDNTIVSVLDTSTNETTGIIPKKSKKTISLVAINKTNKQVSYDISYLSGYENGGELEVNNSINTTYSFPNTPVLDSNMIPIVYDEQLNSWVTADITNTNYKYYWYEYNLGRWANIAITNKNIIFDISNNEHTAKYSNMKLKNGIAIFDNNNSKIDCGLENYNFNNKFTISLNLNLKVLNGETTILSNDIIRIFINNEGYLSIRINNNNYISDYKLIPDTYHNITFTYNGKNIELYVDNNKTNINDNSLSENVQTTSQPIIIGNSSFLGEISDFIIFNNSLSIEYINTYLKENINKTAILNNLSNSLILYYDFTEGINVPTGTIIKDNNNLEIKAYYTWIPRYKYKVWNIEKESGVNILDEYNPYNNGIDIVFEHNTNTTGTISCNYNNKIPNNSGTLSETCTGENGEYYTHPAFTLGSKELTGLWISKYELTLDNNQNIVSKNNRIINLSNHKFDTIWDLTTNMTKTNNIYNFTNKLDSHLIKNIDWGAIAYLSNSRYGLCPNNKCMEIGINNYLSSNNEYQTGCGSNIREISNICNDYNTKEGMKSSTTSNVYGIYDMSGAANEYVMATINTTIPKIDKKYYDTYTNISTPNLYTQESYNRSRLGDAIGEISQNNKLINNGWYNSKLELGNTNNNILRGGNISINSTQFSISTDTTSVGYRGVLTEK